MTDTRSTPARELADYIERSARDGSPLHLTNLDKLAIADSLRIANTPQETPRSESAAIAPPTEEEIAAYRDLFRSELDKNMHNSSGSPSTDAHTVALHAFVQNRNKERK